LEVGAIPMINSQANINTKHKMKKETKAVGMIHIPGKNDKQWEEFLDKNKKEEQVRSNLWYQLP
jgi:hypothetical protein